MEELIASKYEDISNRRKALYMEILTSEKDDRSLENMLKETISMRKKIRKNKHGLRSQEKKNSYDYCEPSYSEINV